MRAPINLECNSVLDILVHASRAQQLRGAKTFACVEVLMAHRSYPEALNRKLAIMDIMATKLPLGRKFWCCERLQLNWDSELCIHSWNLQKKF